MYEIPNRTKAYSATAYWVAASRWTLHGGFFTGIEVSMDLLACKDGSEKKVEEISWD